MGNNTDQSSIYQQMMYLWALVLFAKQNCHWGPFEFILSHKLVTQLRVHVRVCHSLFPRGRKKAHHLHGQLKPLKVMLQVLSFNSEAVL